MNTILQTLINGALGLSILANVAAIAPVDKANAEAAPVIIEQSQDAVLAATAPMDEEVSRMTVKVTAYSSTEDQTDDSPFITASGAHVADGIVAANFLPLHTHIRIPALFGEKVFVVEDRMAKRFSDRVDIWMADRPSAWKFGLRHAEIVVLK